MMHSLVEASTNCLSQPYAGLLAEATIWWE
jgi:hypothetical protein